MGVTPSLGALQAPTGAAMVPGWVWVGAAATFGVRGCCRPPCCQPAPRARSQTPSSHGAQCQSCSDASCNPNPSPNLDAGCNPDPDAGCKPDPNPNPSLVSDAVPDAVCNPDHDAGCSPVPNPNPDSGCNPNPNPDPNPDPDAGCNPNPSPNPSLGSDGGCNPSPDALTLSCDPGPSAYPQTWPCCGSRHPARALVLVPVLGSSAWSRCPPTPRTVVEPGTAAARQTSQAGTGRYTLTCLASPSPAGDQGRAL
ncbi:mucin-1-like [Aquila chrysaetos chrysaetos]|uniref:mucin-1-like n=1 Tax=Aquila chrysaetos chrysaetos TaxID=223781 RepID=UPI001B7D3A29|nr:mucin-1-like [Aquila chrysaetos chrysaetos]